MYELQQPKIHEAKVYQEVVLKGLEASPYAGSSFPESIARKSPELLDPLTSIDLPPTGIRNIKKLGKTVELLSPGQSMQVLLEQLSQFRAAIYGRVSEEVNDQTLEQFRDLFVKGSPYKNDINRGDFITNGHNADKTVSDTNVDVYSALIAELSIDGAPTYEELLTVSLRDHDDSSLDFYGPTLITKSGAKAIFFMQGKLHDSDIDDAPEYKLGVWIYKPHGEDSTPDGRA